VLLDYLRRHHIALVALFVALGGTSYAALKLPANSVGSKQIKKNAVNSAKVKNSSLLKSDFKSGQLPAGPAGPRGSQGTPGSQGGQGAKGVPGPTASSFASHDPMDFPVGNGIDTQVITLTDGTDGRSGGLLNVPFNARVVVSASLLFSTTPGGSPGQVFCRSKIAPDGGGYTTISQQTRSRVDGSIQVPIAAAVDVGPGVYNVQVACYYFGGVAPPPVTFEKGDLTVVATAR